MKARIRSIQLIYLLLAMAALLSSCTVQVGSEEKQAEKMQISVAFWDAKQALSGDMVLQTIEDRFNVQFVPQNITWSDYHQKVERWAATGNLPDLFVGDFRNTPFYLQWIQKGLIRQIPDDLSAFPNLSKYLKNLLNSTGASTEEGLFCIPRQSYPSQAWTSIDRIVAYRWDLALKAGITKEPENWDEFCKMISAIMASDPDQKSVKGLTAVSPDFISSVLLPYASSTAVSDGNSFYWEKAEDGRYMPVYFNRDLLPAFKMARSMYESGIIEKDIAMQTLDGALEKFLQGENAAIVYSGGFGNIYERVNQPWKDIYGHDYTEDVKALRLMPDIQGNPSYPVWGYAWSETYINGSISDAKCTRILEIFDWLLSDEGSLFAAFGPEGDLYEVTDGKVVLHETNETVNEKYPSCALFSQLVRWNSSVYGPNYVSSIPEIYMQVNQDLVSQAENVMVPDYEPACTDAMHAAGIDFTIQVGDDFLRIMTGSKPVEQIWNEIRQEYETKGLYEMIETVNTNMQK